MLRLMKSFKLLCNAVQFKGSGVVLAAAAAAAAAAGAAAAAAAAVNDSSVAAKKCKRLKMYEFQ